MLNRRSFLRTSSLLAVGSTVPEFLARTALAAAQGKDSILVVLELTGGNDGLNTVIPFADDLYYKNRPTLGVPTKQVLKIDDHVGLHPRLDGLHALHKDGQLAVVQGVGYPNPDRSHFESMDIWQSADPTRKTTTGWVARSTPLFPAGKGVPAMFLGADKLPLALQGAPGGVLSVEKPQDFALNLSGPADRQAARRKLIEDLSAGPADGDDLTAFVRRRQVQAFASADTIKKAIAEGGKKDAGAVQVNDARSLGEKLNLVATLIRSDFGTRVYYVALDGFDTHSRQADEHGNLLNQVGDAVRTFFTKLKESKHDERVLLMTYSEFGRRVRENGSRGTDHGAASCVFVAGPGVKGGAVNPHPKLDDLDGGDLKFGIDFRRVYATLLDGWLGADSRAVLGARYEPVGVLKKG
jgi:uncharacterized protein (DUF1501 family)